MSKPRTHVDLRFARVASAFANDPQVSRGAGKGFGAGALKVNGKIFAMLSSKGAFVVKLPKARVDQLVGAGRGHHFDPGHGRLLKEWIVVPEGSTSWAELAKEAHRYVGAAKHDANTFPQERA